MPQFLITDLKRINPKTDFRWIPDGKNIWFLPSVLDLKNHSYCGYWYATKTVNENMHIHTGTKYKKETIDAASYLKEAKKHYKRHGLSLENIFINQ